MSGVTSDVVPSLNVSRSQAVDEWGTVAKGIANGKSYIRFSKVRVAQRGGPSGATARPPVTLEKTNPSRTGRGSS